MLPDLESLAPLQKYLLSFRDLSTEVACTGPSTPAALHSILRICINRPCTDDKQATKQQAAAVGKWLMLKELQKGADPSETLTVVASRRNLSAC